MAETTDDTETGTIALTAPPAPPAPPALDPARGQIEITTVPSSVEHRALFDIDTKIRNTGGSTGTFRVQMFMNGVIQQQSSQFSLAAGAVSGFKSLQATAPTSGTSMTYGIKCIRIS